MLDNAEEVMHSLEEFSKLKPKVIPRELEDYIGYVAKTGDPVFKWSMVKYLFREKMLSVINDFYEDTLTIDLPPCPNVDAFNYDRMKTNLLDRLEAFHGAPFTIQRFCELLTNPRKEYNRADKFMRAIEKNILVVSTKEPGRYSDSECENSQECSINGIREIGDSLDTTFMINDLGPGVDTSSPRSEGNDSLPEANHLATVDRVSPVLDQEVSSDSDDGTLENGHISIDGSTEKASDNDPELGTSSQDADGSNVSSTDMSLSLIISDDIPCEDASVNPVSSSQESLISNQQIGFVVSPSLGEVLGSVEGSSVEALEPCILPDNSLLNEVIDEADTKTKADMSQAVDLIDMNKTSDSQVSEDVENSELHSCETTSAPVSIIEAVECDTSQNEHTSSNDINQIDQSETACDTNEPSTADLIKFSVSEICEPEDDSDSLALTAPSKQNETVECDTSQTEHTSSINVNEVDQSDTLCDTNEPSTEDLIKFSVSEMLEPEDQSSSLTLPESSKEKEVVSPDESTSSPGNAAEIDLAEIDRLNPISSNVEASDIEAHSTGTEQAHCTTSSEDLVPHESPRQTVDETPTDVPDEGVPGDSVVPSQQAVIIDVLPESEVCSQEPVPVQQPECLPSEPMDVDE